MFFESGDLGPPKAATLSWFSVATATVAVKTRLDAMRCREIYGPSVQSQAHFRQSCPLIFWITVSVSMLRI